MKLKAIILFLFSSVFLTATADTPDSHGFKGSFIQHYLVAQWDDSRWDTEMTMLKEACIEYLVYGPAHDRDSDGNEFTLYPSLSLDTQHDQSLEKCLASAQRCGIKIFIGINFDSRWWSVNKDRSWVVNAILKGNMVTTELVELYKHKYPDAMHGWYWYWEVANIVDNTPETTAVLARLLNLTIDHIDSISPGMPLMLSPYMNESSGISPEHYGQFWSRVFSLVHFREGDIFGPQDSVGAGGTTVESVGRWFAAFRKAVDTCPGLLLWGNVETFDQRFWTSAPLDRLIKQSDAIRPYVSKLICFSYSHYLSPSLSNPSRHAAMVLWNTTGNLPPVTVPSKPENVTLTTVPGGVTIKWEPLSCDNNSTADGVSIYRDGILVNRLQCRPGTSVKEYTDTVGNSYSRYEITTYNICGKESQAVVPTKIATVL